MANKEEEIPAFKVVDRRSHATEEDGCCGGHDHHHHHQEAKDTAPADSGAVDSERPAMTFSWFVQTLAHQAMMGLGIVPWPDSGLVKIELGLAKETIDILAMLKEKSQGNLTNDEQLMLDSLIYQLRVAFVEISKSPQGNAPVIK